MTSISSLLLVLGLFFYSLAYAEKPRIEDEPIVYTINHTDVKVFSNGRTILTETVEAKIQNEEGKNNYSTKKIYFNPNNEKVKVLEAYTMTGDKKYNLDSKDIVDRDVSNAPSGFALDKEKYFSFQKIEVGSIMYFRIQREFHDKTMGSYWSRTVRFGTSPILDFKFEIESEMPLYQKVIDPFDNLSITGSEKHWKVTNKNPIFFYPFGEDYSFLSESRQPIILFSNAKEWKSVQRDINDEIVKLLQRSLPKEWKAAIEKIKFLSDGPEKLIAVHHFIHQRFRYWGDWRESSQGIIPRTLDRIINSGYGDCKDLSLLGIKILRDLGFSAYPALVQRSSPGPNNKIYEIPINYFNHMIVYAEKNGKEYWLDFTNPNYFGPIPPDLFDRPSLVYKENENQLKQTPKIEPDDLKSRFEAIIESTKIKNLSHIRLTTIHEGQEQSYLLDRLRPGPEKTILRRTIFEIFPQISFEDFKYVRESSLTSEKIIYDFDVQNLFMTSNAGRALKLPLVAPFDSIPNTLFKNRWGDFDFKYPPYNHSRRLVFKNKKVKNPEILNCQTDNTYLSFKQKFYQKGKDAIFEQSFISKTREVILDNPNSTQLMTAAQKVLFSCASNAVLVFND